MAYQNNATDMVFDFITNKIRQDEWRPNMKIWSEQKLCDHLQVSRIAVRQAIEKFTTMNVLRKKQGAGTFINDIKDISLMGLTFVSFDISAVNHLLEFRKILEPSSIQLFIERATDEDIGKLEESFVKMKECQNDSKEYYHYDYQFHSIIANGTKNPYIIKVYEIFKEYFEMHQQILTDSVGPSSGIYWHDQILHFIKEKNTELAVAFSRQHVEHSMRKYSQFCHLDQDDHLENQFN